MSYVNTVLGTIHPAEMGITLQHEHILWGPPGWEFDPEWWFHYPKLFQKCLADMREFRDMGGRTIVDASGINMGRDVEFYRMISRYSGVHVVCSTGFWAGAGLYNYFRDKDIEYLENLFVHEITVGMGNSGAKAGVIKVGNGNFGFTEYDERIHRAAARAAKRTGAAIITHGVLGIRRQVEVFEDEHFDLSRVMISHCSDNTGLDLERDKEVARKGAWAAYDTFSITNNWSWADYATYDDVKGDLVKAMIDAGLIDRVLISADVNLFSLGWARSNPYSGKTTVADGLRAIIGQFMRLGLDEGVFKKIMIDNPREVVPIY
jgi:phosphotriesterase-related protein